jgi:hypothetical protein
VQQRAVETTIKDGSTQFWFTAGILATDWSAGQGKYSGNSIVSGDVRGKNT